MGLEHKVRENVGKRRQGKQDGPTLKILKSVLTGHSGCCVEKCKGARKE